MVVKREVREYVAGEDPFFEGLADKALQCSEDNNCDECDRREACLNEWDRRVVPAASLGSLENQYQKIDGRLDDVVNAGSGSPTAPAPSMLYTAPCLEPSRREIECVGYIARGYTAQHAAGALKISEQTLKNHLLNLRRKLSAFSTAQVIYILTKDGTI